MLDKTIKEVYLIVTANPDSPILHSTITDELQKYADLKQEYKNMAAEEGLYNTSNMNHNWYSKQIMWKFQTV